jgi:hypothetical protein
MFSNILAGAAGFPVADLGDEISHSLRFRNDSGVSAQYLHNTSLAGYQLSNYTISVLHLALFSKMVVATPIAVRNHCIETMPLGIT